MLVNNSLRVILSLFVLLATAAPAPKPTAAVGAPLPLKARQVNCDEVATKGCKETPVVRRAPMLTAQLQAPVPLEPRQVICDEVVTTNCNRVPRVKRAEPTPALEFPERRRANQIVEIVQAAPAVAARALCNGTIELDTKTQSYTVAATDTLTSIAKKFNRGICDIAKANAITNVNVINNGVVLTIPAQVCIPDSASCLSPTAEVTATCILGGPGFYVVVSGDTLTAIATGYQITLKSLIAANPQIENPDLIFVAQVINIPVCPGSSCTIAPYTIKSGDIFFDLAAKFSSTAGQLLALNTGTVPSNLQIGQNITLVSVCKGA